VEVDPIIIRIQAIDEATDKIKVIASSLKNLEIKMPEMNMGGSYKQVNVIKRNLESALTPLQTLERQTMNFQRQLDRMPIQPIERLNQSLQIAGISENQFTSFLQKNNMEVIKGIGVYDQLTGAIITQGQAVKLATIDTRRFKMEWLSIMFAGMALDRVFGSLIGKQFELFGVTELLSAAWTITLLPIMEIITPLIYSLLDAFMNLPTGIQTAIGVFVLFGAILGKVFSIFGQIFLGIKGITTLFPGLGTTIYDLGATILGLGSTFLIIAGVILAVVVGMYLAWKTNFLGMKDTVQGFIDGVKQIFGGIVSIFKGILDIVVGLFTGDFNKVKKGIQEIFSGLWDFLVGGFKTAFNLIAGIVKGSLLIIYNIIKVLVDGIIWVANALGKVAGKKTNLIDFKMPSFKEGGIMPYTGVAYLHAGEKVIPRNQVESQGEEVITFSPTINLNASVNSDIDIRDLASKLNTYWAADFARMTQRRIA
jgi:hypothetical protein